MKIFKKNAKKRLKKGEKCDIIIYGEVLNITIALKFDKNNSLLFKNLKNQKEVSKKKRMNNQNLINVIDAAKYLIQFFYKSGEKYHCTKTKIEKMLTIAFLTFIKNDRKLFSSKIYIAECGTYIPLLSRFIFGNITEGQIPENNLKIDKNVALDGNIPPLYSIETQVSEDIHNILADVFYAFGNYEPSHLGKLLDEFKMEISIEDEEDPSKSIIDSEKAIKFFNEKSYKKTNDIIDYIVNYSSDNKNAENKE